MKMIVWTYPIKDPHVEKVDQDWIVDFVLIYLMEPLHPLDHVHPESIVKEGVRVHVPPPTGDKGA